MITMARSPHLKRWAQSYRAGSNLAARYVAGETAHSAVVRAQALTKDGIRSSLFYLGEYVENPTLVAENVAAKLDAVQKLAHANLDIHISIDPTQVGYQLDKRLARANLFTIGEAVAHAGADRRGVHTVMLDMEDASIVDETIALHAQLLRAGLPAAIVLQAYLRRTEDDLRPLIARGAKVRLVQGAFAAGPSIAFTRRAEIKANFRHLVSLMFSRTARDAGFYPSIATHDPNLHDFAIQQANENGWKPGEYEFELLLGVRGDLARKLVSKGERVRLYVPFGFDWWPHALRRIGESPRNGGLLIGSLIRRAPPTTQATVSALLSAEML